MKKLFYILLIATLVFFAPGLCLAEHHLDIDDANNFLVIDGKGHRLLIDDYKVTVNNAGPVLELSNITGDWDYRSEFPKYTSGIGICALKFIPGAPHDCLVLKNNLSDGPEISKLTSIDGMSYLLENFPTKPVLQPYIDYSASNLSTGATIVFVIDW